MEKWNQSKITAVHPFTYGTGHGGVIVSGHPPETHVPSAVLFASQSNISFKQAMY